MKHTLILTPRYTTDAQLLWNAANSLGWDVIRLTSWHLTDEIKEAEWPVLYVEALFAPTIAEELHVAIHEPPNDFLPSLPKKYLKREVKLTTLGKAKQGEKAFVKPPNDKSFNAGIYEPENLPTYFSDDTPVLVSEIVSWKKEFRCFITHQRVEAASVYMWDGKFQGPNNFGCTEENLYEAIGFAQTVASNVGCCRGKCCLGIWHLWL